jgi:hypothetical protein
MAPNRCAYASVAVSRAHEEVREQGAFQALHGAVYLLSCTVSSVILINVKVWHRSAVEHHAETVQDAIYGVCFVSGAMHAAAACMPLAHKFMRLFAWHCAVVGS